MSSLVIAPLTASDLPAATALLTAALPHDPHVAVVAEEKLFGGNVPWTLHNSADHNVHDVHDSANHDVHDVHDRSDVDLDDGGMSTLLFADNIEYWVAVVANFEKHISGG